MNPFAFFDCLAVSHRLAVPFGNAAVPEIHLFAYIACLLSLYRGHPVSSWEYTFAGTKEGSPFSTDIGTAIEMATTEGYCEDRDGFIHLTGAGEIEYGQLASLKLNQARDGFIEAACASTLTLPIGYIREAIASDPNMRSAASMQRARALLDEDAIDGIYEIFKALSELVGVDVNDLMLPAVVWIRYLAESAHAHVD